MRRSPLVILWLTLPFLAVVAVGAIVLRDTREAERIFERTAAWPTAEGRVIESKVNTWERTSRGKNARRVTVHAPDILYGYTVGGVEHRSRGIRRGDLADADRAAAERIVARYPVGAAVKVMYDPDRPGDAWLENPPPQSPWPALLGFGLVFIAMGIAQWIHFLRKA